MSFGFLSKSNEQSEDAAQLSSGGGDFGNIAEWSAGLELQIFIPSDAPVRDGVEQGMVDELRKDIETSSYRTSETRNGNMFAFFKSRTAADALSQALGEVYDRRFWASTILSYTSDLDGIINMTADTKAQLSDPYNVSTQASSIRARFGRHIPFHLVTLPSAVQAYAMAVGFLSEQVYDYSSLPFSDSDLTLEVAEQLLNDQDGAEVQGLLGSGDLAQARAKLWAALGEDNPNAYVLTPGDAYEVTAGTNLAKTIDAVTTPHKAWLRIQNVLDPRPDATNDEGKHYTVPVITEVFKSKEDAFAAAGVSEADVKTTPKKGKSRRRKGKSDGPQVPSGWTEADWIETLHELADENEGMSIADLAALANEELEEGVDLIAAWLEKMAL